MAIVPPLAHDAHHALDPHLAHDDAAVRWAAIGTFAVYVQIEVWRQRPEWGKLLLIVMLLAGGAAAIAAGLRQEKEGRG